MSSVPSAPTAAQDKSPQIERYRIEAGYPVAAVGQVDVLEGRIVAAPAIWRKFVGQELWRLERWLAAKCRTCQKRRMGGVE